MSTDLFTLLDLPSKFSVYKLLLVTSDDLNNASFVVHSLLQSRLRTKATVNVNPVVTLITLNQAYSHYSTVAAKAFGLNFKSLKDDGKLVCFDLLSQLDQFSPNGQFDLKQFADSVVEHIVNSYADQATQQSPCVIVDDLTTFLSLGCSLQEVCRFVAVLRNLSFKHNLCLIVQLNLPQDPEDDDVIKLITWLNNACDVWLEINKLQTGFSQQVDGTIDVHDRRKLLSSQITRKLHFKTADRNTKLFHPGTVV